RLIICALEGVPAGSIALIDPSLRTLAALLAAAGAEVTSVEIFADLSARATQTILDVGFAAVRTVVGDGSQGWPEGGPWDGILVSASAPEIPDTLLDSLAEHGRLVAVVGEDPTMQTIIMRRRADGGFHKQSLFETHVAPMIGLERKRVFSF
ncbi:MAG: protein-L-isoaspartate O-methyltransferase family protein, partial [Arenicellales bacterium]